MKTKRLITVSLSSHAESTGMAFFHRKNDDEDTLVRTYFVRTPLRLDRVLRAARKLSEHKKCGFFHE